MALKEVKPETVKKKRKSRAKPKGEVKSAGRKKLKLTVREIATVKRLAGRLSQNQLAEYLGITDKTFREILKREPHIFTAYAQGRAKSISKVAGALFKKACDGDVNAQKFYLATQAGWREPEVDTLEADREILLDAIREMNKKRKVSDSIDPQDFTA